MPHSQGASQHHQRTEIEQQLGCTAMWLAVDVRCCALLVWLAAGGTGTPACTTARAQVPHCTIRLPPAGGGGHATCGPAHLCACWPRAEERPVLVAAWRAEIQCMTGWPVAFYTTPPTSLACWLSFAFILTSKLLTCVLVTRALPCTISMLCPYHMPPLPLLVKSYQPVW